jgi:Dolichyl-phosphate-mannose-protein mannosyltransferase
MLISRPFAETGFGDDFSYVRTAKYLADTGHLDYFGWASAMVGWQLLFGTLFVKLFGFSFSIVRASVFCIAIATTFLLHATFIRSGLREKNATIATLTVILSPLFLPLAFSYMTDVAGLFGIVLCLYCCLRAIEAPEDKSSFNWLLVAAFSNVASGTARQIAWLGVLVLVPSTFLLIRRRRPPLVSFIIVWAFCVAAVFGALHWFQHQYLSQPERIFTKAFEPRELVEAVIRSFLGISLFLLPILISFFAGLTLRKPLRITSVSIAVVATALFLRFGLLHLHRETVISWLAPFGGDIVTRSGLVDMPALGNHPVVLGLPVRIIVTLITSAAAFSFISFLFGPPSQSRTNSEPASAISPHQLALLLGPFTLAYLFLLLPRGVWGSIRDRYLLPLLVVGLIAAVRFFQERVQPDLTLASIVCLATFAAFAIAGTHDKFAFMRAQLTAANNLISAGVPRDAFYGGFEYDGSTQIEQWGYVSTTTINLPQGFHLRTAGRAHKACEYDLSDIFPAINPSYGLSLSPDVCQGPSQFAPVTYQAWLPPFSRAIYTRRIADSNSARESPDPARAP